MNENIELRPVAGFPGYRVGSDGSVWSCYRAAGHGRGRVLSETWRRVGYVDRASHSRGYAKVVLYRGGKRHQRKVHQLVLEAFVGPRPPGTQCLHGDDNRSNNRLDNLRWGTQAENMGDRVRNGIAPRGETHCTAKFTESLVLRAIELRGEGKSQRAIGEELGMSKSTVAGILNGRVWSHITGIRRRKDESVRKFQRS
jgi:hypothetical protein